MFATQFTVKDENGNTSTVSVPFIEPLKARKALCEIVGDRVVITDIKII